PSSFMSPIPPPSYTLSLHDALPICVPLPLSLTKQAGNVVAVRSQPACSQNVSAVLQPLLVLSKHPGKVFVASQPACSQPFVTVLDRKSTRLNSSHGSISYAVFCLKK